MPPNPATLDVSVVWASTIAVEATWLSADQSVMRRLSNT
jgi:hypothetical protein